VRVLRKEKKQFKIKTANGIKIDRSILKQWGLTKQGTNFKVETEN